MSDKRHPKLAVSHDEASGFWTGKPWLVIDEEGEPAVASFKTDGEAFDFIDEQEAEQSNHEPGGNPTLSAESPAGSILKS